MLRREEEKRLEETDSQIREKESMLLKVRETLTGYHHMRYVLVTVKFLIALGLCVFLLKASAHAICAALDCLLPRFTLLVVGHPPSRCDAESLVFSCACMGPAQANLAST